MTAALVALGILAAWDAARRWAARNSVDPAQLDDLAERLNLVEARPDLQPRVASIEVTLAQHARVLTKAALSAR